MNPLILLAGNLFPAILDFVVGNRAGVVSKAVVDAVTAATGNDDPAKVQEKLIQDPALASQLRLELARIAMEEKKLQLEAEAERRKDEADRQAAERKDRLDAEIATQKAALDASMAARKAELDQREIDIRETQGARQMLVDIKDGYVRRTPMVLSYIVAIGFFVVLFMFLLLKNRLEAPSPPTFPSETLGILNTLRPDQIAALVSPRSDFVIQIINICVGALAAAFATVMSFWLGSSQSSRNKDAVVANLQERTVENQDRQARASIEITRQVVESAKSSGAGGGGSDGGDGHSHGGAGGGSGAAQPDSAGTAPETKQQPAPKPQEDPVRTDPVNPMSSDALIQSLPKLIAPHKHFQDGVSWALTREGIAIEGAEPMGTPGQPTTVAAIWRDFGALCATSAKQYGVPVELIVATIFTESAGKPNARRAEPQINDESVGLMQTLVKTARSATGRKTLTGDDLTDPRTSIDAGTAYIALQRSSTQLDPPRVAAAYNAGSIKRDDHEANRRRMHCFPRGTGLHIDKFVARFNDAMKVSARDGWALESGCPSFAAALRAEPAGGTPGNGSSGTGHAPTQAGKTKSSTAGSKIASPAIITDIHAPGFPRKPDFPALKDRVEKDAVFGHFEYVFKPLPKEKDHVDILGNWESTNIVTFTVPIKPHPVLGNAFQMRFHKLAKEQTIALWLAWEKEGLLRHIISWDGDFNPRFMRPKDPKNPPPPEKRSLSNHAWGSAFDINAAQNPLNVEPAAIGKPGCVRELVPLANQHGFYWGGHFNSRKDGMHFEVGKLL